MIPDLSTAWVIAFVLILSVVLDRLLLRPLTRVMDERTAAVRSAREMAESSRLRAQASADEFEARTRAARAELYQQMDAARRTALDRRAEVVADTRRQVEQSLNEATARLQAQTEAAKAQIDRDADAIAATIVERVLGRRVS